MTVRVLVGDALSVLRTLPAESVQCVVTSPPYFGLRAYGTDPQVWGGDPGHSPHEWGGGLGSRKVSPRPDHSGGALYATRGGQPSTAARGPEIDAGASCPCGAWRGELGSEPSPGLFIEHLVSIFDEVWRVLRPDGLCFVNLGDSYSGSGKGPTGTNGLGDQSKRQGFVGAAAMLNPERAPGSRGPSLPGIPAKNLLLIPQRFAIAMQERGWIVRSEIVWAKTSAMPESVRDRPTSAWEPIWMFSKQARYYFDGDAVRQPHQDMNGRVVGGKFVGAGCISRPDYEPNTQGWNQGGMVHRNREYNPLGASLRNVWTLGPSPFADAHFATFPPEIPRRCILAGTSEKGACPACGAPWVRIVKASGGTIGKSWHNHENDLGRGHRGGDNGNVAAAGWKDYRRESLGWQPSCSCPPADPVPCVVLDPFLGSGTTAMVADRLGRDAIGIELSPIYAKMAQERIEKDAGSLFGETVEVAMPTQVGLFDGCEVAG